jgi:GNAT superfamily N-acetyltransferase
MVRGLQERAAHAQPAEQVEGFSGWWLRHAPNCPWWVGTVLPHGDARPDQLVRFVIRAEEFYAGLGARARFQISPPACPPGLDAVLAGRGYRVEGLVSLQVASTATVVGEVPVPSLRVRLEDRPTRAWFEVWHAVHGGDAAAEWAMLERVERSSAYAQAMTGDEVVAVGRAAVDAGWAGVFGMATLSHTRGNGAGLNVLAALAEWADGHAADRMYLQVVRDNVSAVRLYERAGFRELSGYHYRTPD